MGNYTKEERTHIRKNVYAFKLSNDAGEFLLFYWHGYSEGNLFTGSVLEKLDFDLKDSEFIDQYYFCKKFAEENGLTFQEYGEKEWKNIPKTPF